jgi:hypothetical protein
LKEIIKVVLADINSVNKTDYQLKDVKIEFPHQMIVNEQENIQNDKTKAETEQIQVNTILNVAAAIGDEETLKAICDVLDLDYDEISANVEPGDGLTDAQKVLESVVEE